MKTISLKVFSLCNDLSEFHEELSSERSCDVYIDYTANSEKFLEEEGFDNDEVANKLINLGCEENEKVLIHIDY